jgi:hypothetical protein
MFSYMHIHTRLKKDMCMYENVYISKFLFIYIYMVHINACMDTNNYMITNNYMNTNNLHVCMYS